MPELGTPFTRAVTNGLVGPLSTFGFALRESDEGHRGAAALVSNDHVVIDVTLDRLEGELVVALRRVGGRSRPVGDVLDLRRIKGFKTARLTRGISSGSLEAQFRLLANALIDQLGAGLRDEDALTGVLDL